MNLLEIRTQLVKLSGRTDLVVDTQAYADSGANFFIQAGQRLLDGLMESPREMAEFPLTLEVGKIEYSFSEVRAIKRMFVESEDDGIQYLSKNTLKELRDKYGRESSFEERDRGIPTDYALAIGRREVATAERDSDTHLLIMPPPDKEYDLRVEAKYLSGALKQNDDVSWWSLRYPDLLIQAALYKAEVFMRNTQGANDWLGAIQFAVELIDNDQVEEAISEIDQMNNAWNFRTNLPRRSHDY